MENETVKPDLGVLERLCDTSPSELFFSGGVTVFLEPCDHKLPLPGSEETGGGGVIVDKEIRDEGGNDGQEALL